MAYAIAPFDHFRRIFIKVDETEIVKKVKLPAIVTYT